MDWNVINTIYFDPAQDDADRSIQEAAAELQTYLGQMAFRAFTITNTYPIGPAVILNVNTAALEGRGEEAVRIQTSSSVTITGKTAFAVRDGAYLLLNKLGVRWFFRHPDWWVVPSSLLNLGDIDEIHEPDYIWREHFNGNPFVNWDGLQEWKRRNLLGGPVAFRVGHSYYDIMPQTLEPTYPDAFLPENAVFPILDAQGNLLLTGWQLRPDNPDVIEHARAYADAWCATPKYYYYHTNHPSRVAVVSISPNDGWGWGVICPDASDRAKTQALTDLVFGLVDDVAGQLASTHPGYYVGCYCYSLYSEVPTFNFANNNIYVMVATAYDYTPLTDYQRISGYRSRGATVGVRDYLDIYQWHSDMPQGVSDMKRMNSIKDFYNAGALVYIGERGDTSGSCGPLYYVTARLLWDASLTPAAILDEFYTMAFGPAKAPMKNYYDIWFSGQSINNNSLGAAFTALHEAEVLAAGDEAILKRIRYMQYYLYYVWKYQSRTTPGWTLDEMVVLWKFVTKLRDLYVLSWRYVMNDAFHDRLRDTIFPEMYPTATPEEIEVLITNWMNANADYTPPTEAEASAWMNEALAALGGGIIAPYIDPRSIILEPKIVTGKPTYPPPEGRGEEVLVLANAGDIINASLQPNPYEPKEFQFLGPGGQILETVTLPAGRPWVAHDFTASAGKGIYKIRGDGINVLSHSAGIVGGILKSSNLYFYVPEGTPAIIVEFSVGTMIRTLYDPNDNLAGSTPGAVTTSENIGIINPMPGAWHLSFIQGPSWESAVIRLYGVPDLVWHDPSKLLVQAQGVPEVTARVTISATIGGTIAPLPGAYEVEVGESIFLTAYPSTGYTLRGWAENGIQFSTEFSINFPVSQDTSITAVFEMVPTPTHTLTIEATAGGLTTPAPGPHEVLEGVNIPLIATANQNYRFVQWEENGMTLSTDSQMTVNLSSDRTIKAVFEVIPMIINFKIENANESVTPYWGISWRPSDTTTVQQIFNVSVNAPITMETSSLLGDILELRLYGVQTFSYDWSAIQIPIDGDTVIFDVSTAPPTIRYESQPAPPVTLTLSAEGNGTTNPAPGSWDHEVGTEVQIAAIPAAGARFVKWEEDGATLSTEPQINIILNQNRNIVAIFEDIVIPPEAYAVSISVIGQGSTNPSGYFTVEQGTTVTIQATPLSGWTFDHWEGDLGGTNPMDEFQVVGDMSIVAVFSEIPPAPTPTPGGKAIAAGIALTTIVTAAILLRRRKK